jgi:hypothetical protein
MLRFGALSAVVLGQSVAHRWAAHVIKACDAGDDFKTLGGWARYLNVSSTTLAESCRLLGILPHHARDLARALNAIVASAEQNCPPSVVLSIADTRTLRAFERKAGPNFRPAHTIEDIERFLDTQDFVASDNQGMRVLRQVLREVLASAGT